MEIINKVIGNFLENQGYNSFKKIYHYAASKICSSQLIGTKKLLSRGIFLTSGVSNLIEWQRT